MKNGCNIRNVGIKPFKIVNFSSFFVLSKISPYFVRNMSKSSPKFFVWKLLSELFKSEIFRF